MNKRKAMAKMRRYVVASVFFMACIGALYVPPACAREGAAMKTLIVYYSRTGNTKLACETLRKELDCDIIEIRDLSNREGRWGYYTAAFGSIFGTHTEIDPAAFDLAPYSAIIVASPVWAGKPSAAIRTFLEKNRFDGKKMFVVYTTNVLLKETSLDRAKKMAVESGGQVAGCLQIAVTDSVDGERVQRPRERIVDDAVKVADEIRALQQ